MERFLDTLHARSRANPALQRLAIICRILLALAFIPTSLVKVMGERFTALGTDNPIGFFFEAMYQTGAYWRFVGWSQLVAGILVLVPRTATLGAVLFFPIILNIFVITLSLHFTGTPFITGGMLLASTFLLCWDYDRLKAVLFPGARTPAAPITLSRLELGGYALGTLAGLMLFGVTRGLVPGSMTLALLAAGLGAVVIVLVAWVRAIFRVRARTRPA